MFAKGIETLGKTGSALMIIGMGDMGAALGVSVPFLNLLGVVCGAWQWARAATAAAVSLQASGADDGDDGYYRAQIPLARFYLSHVASEAAGLARTITQGGPVVASFDEARF